MVRDPPSFADAAPGVRSARAAAESADPFRGCEWLRSYTGALAEGNGAVLIVTLAPAATASQQRAFPAVSDAWPASQSDAIAAVVGSGAAPRPWVALDAAAFEPRAAVAGDLTGGEVAGVLESVAEGFHALLAADATLPAPHHVVVDAARASGRVLPPLDSRPDTPASADGEEPDGLAVQRLGALGYELLTGTTPPDDGSGGPADELGCVDDQGAQISAVVADALGPAPALESPYEFKRALLFGREESASTERAQPTDRTPATDSKPAREGRSATDGKAAREGRSANDGKPATSGTHTTDPQGSTKEESESADPGDREPVTRADSEEQIVGRREAVGLLGVGLLTLGGAPMLQSTLGGAEGSQPTEAGVQIPQAEFEFETGAGTLHIRHAGGDRLTAANLVVRRPQVNGIDHLPWSDYAGFEPESTVWVGDGITIDRGLSMGVSVLWDRPDAEEFVILDEFPER